MRKRNDLTGLLQIPGEWCAPPPPHLVAINVQQYCVHTRSIKMLH